METKPDWEKTVRRLEQLLRLKSFPVAFKMAENREILETTPFLRRPEKQQTLCQMLNLVRNFDWTVGAELKDFMFPTCPSILGLRDLPETHRDGTFRSIVWVATKADGRRFEASIPRLETGKYQAVLMAPLVYNPFEPDIVLIYCNPAQIMLLVNSLQFTDYQVMEFSCVGESSCSDAIVRCYDTQRPCVGIPCYGERRYGHAQDDEMVMALPANLVTKALAGMEALYRRGVRYPISFAGAEADPLDQFPVQYKRLDTMMAKLKGDDRQLLLGVTGGIGTGKTTVANLLREKGAPIIDFDLLAREVVEPGTRGFDDIVDYFGSQVLDTDGTLDRKRLSKIVFGDMEKRKKLESFTHPAIYEAFFREVDLIAREDPGAVIQVVIPLLVELNLQYLFDRLLVVYVPEELQVRRLAQRDGISMDEAATILKSQIPIDEKRQFADFVVDNSGSLDETREQVDELWSTIEKYKMEE
ncbi:MAG: dephospho-CoA kinase [Desulfobacterium sp.]|nr:dephospho-CoA kinase [Desulfobacterium sp.]